MKKHIGLSLKIVNEIICSFHLMRLDILYNEKEKKKIFVCILVSPLASGGKYRLII